MVGELCLKNWAAGSGSPKSLGIGQEKVAESIGSHPVTISKYERGVQDPSTELKAMAMLYGVSVDWLLGGKVE